MSEPLPPLPPETLAAAAALGDALRDAGYTQGRVGRALGILSWTGPELDGLWWENEVLAEGPFGALVRLLICGDRLTPSEAAALPQAAWEAELLVQVRQRVMARAMVVPMDGDLIWTDRASRSEQPDGLFLPDTTTQALRRCLPPRRVARHLDAGAGAGAVTVAAARLAEETLAVDLNPRSAPACALTAALSGVPGIRGRTARAQDLGGEAPFDRLTFVLPLLVPVARHEGAQIHTVAESPTLLVETLELLPGLLKEGGLALLYTQDHAGELPLPEAIDRAFGGRDWRGVFWEDHPGDESQGEPRAGVLAIRADGEWGWEDVEREALEDDAASWWPALERLLGE